MGCLKLEILKNNKLDLGKISKNTPAKIVRIDHFLRTKKGLENYYPFGMAMANRKGSVESYRYGFNGMEKDDEVKGVGNSYNYGFRIYDNRIGRFLGIDPLAKSYPWLTPFQFASNSPIVASDIDGLEANVEIIPNNNSDKPTLEIGVYIQVDNHSKLTNDIVNNYIAGIILKMEQVMVGTITIKGVEFVVKSIFYLTDEQKMFSLTFKDYGEEYLKEDGVLGEADKIGNT